MQVWVVFADSDARRYRDEDLICYSKAEAQAHMKDLRKMGHEPVMAVYPSEDAFYAWKDRG